MLEFIQNISSLNGPLLKKKKVQSVIYCPPTEKTLVWLLMVKKNGLIHISMFFMSLLFLLSYITSNLPLNEESGTSDK